MNKKYTYIDEACADEIYGCLFLLTEQQVANMVTNIITPYTDKMPSAKIVKDTIDGIWKGINIIRNRFIDVSNTKIELDKSISDVNQYEKDQEIIIDQELQKIEDKIEVFPEGELGFYIVDCKYNEIENPQLESIYIYKDGKKYGLAYYHMNGNEPMWYISGMLIPGLSDLISSDELTFIGDDIIKTRVNEGYHIAKK